jgi:hypothetical protein
MVGDRALPIAILITSLITRWSKTAPKEHRTPQPITQKQNAIALPNKPLKYKTRSLSQKTLNRDRIFKQTLSKQSAIAIPITYPQRDRARPYTSKWSRNFLYNWTVD